MDHVVPSDKCGITLSYEIIGILEKYKSKESILILLSDGEPANRLTRINVFRCIFFSLHFSNIIYNANCRGAVMKNCSFKLAMHTGEVSMNLNSLDKSLTFIVNKGTLVPLGVINHSVKKVKQKVLPNKFCLK